MAQVRTESLYRRCGQGDLSYSQADKDLPNAQPRRARSARRLAQLAQAARQGGETGGSDTYSISGFT